MAEPKQAADRTVVISNIGPDDLTAIIEIDGLITGTRRPELWRQILDGRTADDKPTFLVARANGRVIGFVVGEVRGWEFGSPPCGWLFTIGVRPDYRLAKTGTLLFDALLERFRRQGVTTCRTMLHVDDHLLMSFFRSHGLTAGPYLELEKRLDGDL